MLSCVGLAVVVLAACGGGGGGADAPPVSADAPVDGAGADADPDAAPDAPAPDAPPPPGEVTVTAYTHRFEGPSGAPVAGASVWLVEAGGGVVGPIATDAAGVARFDDVAAGAAVHVVYPDDGDERGYLVSVLGVGPGDAIQTGDRFQDPVAGADGAITLMFAALPGAYYRASHPCGTDLLFEPGDAIFLDADCQVPTATIWVNAYASVGGYALASSRASDASYVPGATVTMPAWTPAAPMTVHMSGIAADAPFPQVYTYASVAGIGDGGGDDGWGGIIEPIAGEATLAFEGLTTGDRRIASLFYANGREGGGVWHAVIAPGDATALEIEAVTMPLYSSPVLDVANHRMSWTQIGGGALDGALVDGEWYPDHVPDPTVPPPWRRWTILAPPGTTEVDWTDWPPEIVALTPAPEDSIAGFGATAVELEAAAGYTGLKRLPEWVLRCTTCVLADGMLAGQIHQSYSGVTH